MPNDPRPELHDARELTIDEARDLARRAAVETKREKAKYYNLLREVRALLKRVDDVLARR
jgi:hypothetical protein